MATTVPGKQNKNSNILHLNSITSVISLNCCFLSSPALTTTSEITSTLESRKEKSTGGLIPVVVPLVIIGVAFMAVLMGLFIYRRRYTHRVAQLTPMHPAGWIYCFIIYTAVKCSVITASCSLVFDQVFSWILLVMRR